MEQLEGGIIESHANILHPCYSSLTHTLHFLFQQVFKIPKKEKSKDSPLSKSRGKDMPNFSLSSFLSGPEDESKREEGDQRRDREDDYGELYFQDI